jgi:hypothetical protein
LIFNNFPVAGVGMNMTDSYLQSLGFAPNGRGAKNGRLAFTQAWSYQYGHLAKDGAALFIEHPLGIDMCRVSSSAAPLAAQDVFLEMSLHDRPLLEKTIKAFYALHGGMGASVVLNTTATFRSFKRAE